jgi:Putative transposase of IS4/5 family (DUF4096)
MAAAPWIASDELWALVEPLLPRRQRRFRYPGRKRLPDRQALQGILFVLHTGSPGSICRPSWASAQESRAGAAWTSGNGRGSLGAAAPAAFDPVAGGRGD